MGGGVEGVEGVGGVVYANAMRVMQSLSGVNVRLESRSVLCVGGPWVRRRRRSRYCLGDRRRIVQVAGATAS